MSVFRNITNKAELAKVSAFEVQKLLNSAGGVPQADQRRDLMRSCVAAWTASFPRGAALAALGVLEESIRRKREQTVESAGTDILAHQRLLTDFLQFTMRERQAMEAPGRRASAEQPHLKPGAQRDRSRAR